METNLSLGTREQSQKDSSAEEEPEDDSYPRRRLYPRRRTNLIVWRHLDYVPSLIVLEEIYGKPDWYFEGAVWTEIATVDVLNYLLERKYIEPSAGNILAGLRSASSHGRDELVRALLDMFTIQLGDEDLSFDDRDDLKSELLGPAYSAIQNGHLSTFKILNNYLEIETDDDWEFLAAALEGTREDVLLYILDLYQYDRSDVIELAVQSDSSLLSFLLTHFRLSRDERLAAMKNAIESGSVNAIKTLLASDVDEPKLGWSSYISNAIEQGRVLFVKFILEQDRRTEVTNRMLIRAAIQGAEMLEVFIRDGRGNLMSIVDDIIMQAGTGIYSIAVVKLILQHIDRVDRLPPKTVLWMLGILRPSLRDREKGMRLAANSREIEIEDLKAEDSNIYNLTIRFILLRGSAGLMNWMIEMNNKQFQRSASDVLDDILTRDDDLTWLRALMFCMLYPKLTVENLLNNLRTQRVSRATIEKTAVIIGLYLGESGIEKRAVKK